MRISRRRARSIRVFMLLLGALLTGFGVLGVTHFASDALEHRVPDDFVVVDGTVVEVERETRYSRRRFGQGDPFTVCAPVVEVTIDGQAHRTTPDGYAYQRDLCDGAVIVGDRLPVAYAPGQPQTLRLAETDAVGQALFGAGAAALGLVLGGHNLYVAIWRPEKTIAKGVRVVEDAADATPLPLGPLTLLGGLMGGILVMVGVHALREPPPPTYVVTEAVIVDDSIPLRGTEDCAPRAVIYPDGSAIPVPLGTLGSSGPHFCSAQVGDTFLAHHPEGDPRSARFGPPPEDDRELVEGATSLAVGLALLGSIAYAHYRRRAKRHAGV